MDDFSHINNQGGAQMVDVTGKEATLRTAVARGELKARPEVLERIREGTVEKGAVLETARVAAVMAVKKTPDMIPMCHPLFICGVSVDFTFMDERTIAIKVRVKTRGTTGVEMEALTGVSAAALTVYDMCKSLDKGMEINNICLIKKTGGQSGTYTREGQ